MLSYPLEASQCQQVKGYRLVILGESPSRYRTGYTLSEDYCPGFKLQLSQDIGGEQIGQFQYLFHQIRYVSVR